MFPNELLIMGIPKDLVVLIMSALPVSELRGSLPVAINIFDMPWYRAFILAIIGNFVPVPFLLLFSNRAMRFLSKIGFIEKVLTWSFERTRGKGRIVENYGQIGLMLFVAIPLPFTGAWTGSLAAVIFRLKLKYALFSILLGIVIAATIVVSLSLLGWVGAIIAGIGLSTIAILGMRRTEN